MCYFEIKKAYIVLRWRATVRYQMLLAKATGERTIWMRLIHPHAYLNNAGMCFNFHHEMKSPTHTHTHLERFLLDISTLVLYHANTYSIFGGFAKSTRNRTIVSCWLCQCQTKREKYHLKRYVEILSYIIAAILDSPEAKAVSSTQSRISAELNGEW